MATNLGVRIHSICKKNLNERHEQGSCEFSKGRRMCKFCVDGVGDQDFDIFSGRPIGGFNKSFCPPNRGLGAKSMVWINWDHYLFLSRKSFIIVIFARKR
jgi:hypothetical protein